MNDTKWRELKALVEHQGLTPKNLAFVANALQTPEPDKDTDEYRAFLHVVGALVCHTFGIDWDSPTFWSDTLHWVARESNPETGVSLPDLVDAAVDRGKHLALTEREAKAYGLVIQVTDKVRTLLQRRRS
jgi:hypothetical protein